ncbi:MAG: 3,4-dihydroxy-2-butanone-4-phosphate synthase [Sandaracinaceae bacterium]|nr:3,4-dihydroxy-2-butanone-4-phosphate synthase [Sandaracinaceae bacterium]
MRADSLERVHRALEDVRAGRMVILVDDEDRENEGDLCMAAERVTPEAINFMARHARGLICLTLTEDKVKQLELPMMVDENRSSRATAFTVSIEARFGVSTGISAADRSHTIRTAVAREAKPSDIVSPGHIFPLRARPGGVLQRTGHTEGSVDLARLAGFDASGVICEIMNDDGTMARLSDLSTFAEIHGLRILSIAELIEYRLQTERLVHSLSVAPVSVPSGMPWVAHAYETSVDGRQFLAMTLGDIHGDEPILVRVHTGSVLGDVFGARRGDRVVAADAMTRIEAEGRGVVLFIPGSVNFVRDLAFHSGQQMPVASPEEQGAVLREFGLGAQVLADLGLRRIRLLTNRPRRLAGVDAYGLDVVEQVMMNGEVDETTSTSRTTH